MKLLKRSLLGLSLFILLAGIGIYFFLKSSLAPLDGHLPLKNLQEPVRVVRDSYGIPHIFAQNKIDALRALGFVNASERLFQMELSRRMTQGELSEIFGEVALPSDKLYRSLMLKRSIQRMIDTEKSQGHFDERVWKEMEAYMDGINQYVSTQKLPYEFQVLGFKPRPFEPLDAYILTGHMAYSFGIALKADPLMSELAKLLPQEQWQDLRNDPIPGPQNTAAFNYQDSFRLLTEGLFVPSFEGSNAWLIAPSRSQSGKSLFANDPHIGFSLPSVWAEAHISTPEFELYGHYLPLVPFAILGHNKHHAWGFTMSLADDMDLYKEELDLKNKTVLFKGQPVPYQEWKEIIKVKDQADITLDMIETPHGPLMDHVMPEKGLSLKWAFHRPENDPLKALHHMAEAPHLKAFEKALQEASAPGLNVMYADADNIAWWIVGDMALKKNPHSDKVLNGSSGADEYERLLTWEEKPHQVNPPSGIIVTANSRPEGLNKNMRGDWQSEDRYQTLTQALSEKDLWNVEDIKALQTENYNSKNRILLEQLLKNLHLPLEQSKLYANQLESLKNWNFLSETNSVEAALFYQWQNENILLLLAHLEKNLKETYLDTPYAWSFYERAILNPQAAWWSDKDYSKIVTDGFVRACELLKHKPTWGELHTVEYKHPLGRSAPLSWLLNVGPLPIPGAYNDINNNKMRALGGDFKVIAGPSTRRIIDFASPQKSWGINPLGVSGHLLSPYYKDQANLFIQGKYRDQLMDPKDIETAKSHEMILEP